MNSEEERERSLFFFFFPVLFVFWKGTSGRALLENERGRMRSYVYFLYF